MCSESVQGGLRSMRFHHERSADLRHAFYISDGVQAQGRQKNWVLDRLSEISVGGHRSTPSGRLRSCLHLRECQQQLLSAPSCLSFPT